LFIFKDLIAFALSQHALSRLKKAAGGATRIWALTIFDLNSNFRKSQDKTPSFDFLAARA
jgi:hypothetical protein